MKKIIFTITFCLPIVLLAQSNEAISTTYKADLQQFSQERFTAEIPYIDTANLKPISLGTIVKNVNKDQVELPASEQVFLDKNLKRIKFEVHNTCLTKIDVDHIFLKKH